MTVRYAAGHPVGVQSVVVSWQHSPTLALDEIRAWLQRFVVDAIIPPKMRTDDFVVHLNPGGRFTAGDPKADTGLTGRKIIVDTYGGAAPHGGGAFSGKDPSKVDRSGAYAARLERKATVQLSHAIGLAEPISTVIDPAGTGAVPDDIIAGAIRRVFDLSPAGIIDALGLKRPIYTATSSLGHFGALRDSARYPWEGTDRAARLRDAVRLTMAATRAARL